MLLAVANQILPCLPEKEGVEISIATWLHFAPLTVCGTVASFPGSRAHAQEPGNEASGTVEIGSKGCELGCELDCVYGGGNKGNSWWLCDLSLSLLILILSRINQDAEGREEAVGTSG